MTIEGGADVTCGIVAPSYNNAGTVPVALDALSRLGFAVIVVDDGSTDGTAEAIGRWLAGGSTDRMPMRFVETHGRNRGKGAALRTGFRRARELGWTHVLSIDTDGQHHAEDALAVADAARRHPLSIVCGVRDADAAGMPGRSSLGRQWSNRMVAWNCGVRTDDSQCGFRAYPLRFLEDVRIPEERFEFEAACLVRCGWIGVDARDVPVRCTYDVEGGRVSHHRAVRDSLRAIGMYARLLLISGLPRPVRRHPDLPVPTPEADAVALPRMPGTLFTRFLRWLDPRFAWRAVRSDPVGRRRFAVAIAVGTFIANLPAYGGQIALSLVTARWLRLPPLPVVTGAHLSTPPIGPFLVALAIGLGSRIRHGAWPTPADFDPRDKGWLTLVQNVLVEWLIGSVIIGVACAVIAFGIATVILALLSRAGDTDSR